MEGIYKLMNRAGGTSIAIGVIMLVCGIAAGVIAIVTGAKLLAGKHKIEF